MNASKAKVDKTDNEYQQDNDDQNDTNNNNNNNYQKTEYKNEYNSEQNEQKLQQTDETTYKTMASTTESKQPEQKQQKDNSQLIHTKQSTVALSKQLSVITKLLKSQRSNTEIKKEKQEAEKLSLCFHIMKFVIITVPGILVILAIGAIVFYALDSAFSIFDFNLSKYTYWIITILCLANFTMFICGCCGTFVLSQKKK
eukprot:315787_1